MGQLEKLKIRLSGDVDVYDTTNDEILVELLDSAKAMIMNKRFPFGTERTELEPQYLQLQVDLAVVLYNKIGVEGQTAHTEGVISRAYQSEESLLQSVISKGKVL